MRFLVADLDEQRALAYPDGAVSPSRLTEGVCGLLSQRWPAARLLPSGGGSVLHDVIAQFPHLIVLVAAPSGDLRELCAVLREWTDAPIVVIGSSNVAGYLLAGADACIPTSSDLALMGAYVTAVLRRCYPKTLYENAWLEL